MHGQASAVGKVDLARADEGRYRRGKRDIVDFELNPGDMGVARTLIAIEAMAQLAMSSELGLATTPTSCPPQQKVGHRRGD